MTTPEPEIHLLDEERKKTLKAIKSKLARIAKAIKNAQAQYAQSQEFEEVKHLAELLKANFFRLQKGMDEINVEDWKRENAEVTIALDTSKTPQEMLEEMFTKSQKLKKALSPLEALFGKLNGEVERWQKAKEAIEQAESLDAIQAMQKELHLFEKKEKKPKEKLAPYHHFRSEAGLDIFVGKNAQSNDFVTFQLARGNDLWLHAQHMSGAHVVVRKKKNTQVDPETLHDALHLALYFSKARQTKGSFDVLVTERKYVSRLPRMPKGKVVVSKHKTHSLSLDKDRIEKIKSR